MANTLMIDDNDSMSFSRRKEDNTNFFSQWPDDYPVYSEDPPEVIVEKPHVLIVDDHPVVLNALEEMFRKIGYHVYTACGSAKALLYFGKRKYNLVATGFEMGALDGYQLARIIKRHALDTKVVIMTGYCQAELTEIMYDESVDGWLFKPFCIDDLNAMLRTIGLPDQSATQ